MSGRRSHVRFAMLQSPGGVLRVMRDVAVERADEQELVVISRDPGVRGEVVVVQITADDTCPALRVCVIESQPIVVNGNVRHRLRLLDADPEAAPADTALQGAMAPQ